MKKIFFLLFLSACIVNTANAQKFYVTGNVTDSISGETIWGMAVIVKGTTIGTVCDLDGNFRLPVNYNDVLVFSFIGYKTIEYKITGRDRYLPIIIQMVEDNGDEGITKEYSRNGSLDAKHLLSLGLLNDKGLDCNCNE